MKRSLLAAAAALLMATTAQAGFYDGAKLHELCSDRDRAICMGYAAGLVDTLLQSEPWANAICPPPNVKLGSVTDIIARELANHPELRHLSAASIATTALRKAFPCPGRP